MRRRFLLRCTPLTHPRRAILGCDPWPRVSPMRRRDLITPFGGAAAAWPLAARAQQARTVARVGVLGPNLSNPYPSTLYQAILAKLRESGFSEGQNLAADYQAVDDPRGPFVAAIDLVRP